MSELQSVEVEITPDKALTIKLSGKPALIEARLKTIQVSLKEAGTEAKSVQDLLRNYLLNQLATNAPERNGDSLTWSLSLSEAFDKGLAQSLGHAIVESNRAMGMKQLQGMGLAFHNYYSANRKFPSVTTSNGQPRKLSWRVDLLPYLGYGELAKEFHLDEPWDSEHNKQLIPRMPAIFRCPQSKHSMASGLSTFVLPVHEKAMWVKGTDIDFKDIHDGTSNTVMVVEARDELAQIWTKPDPFEIDLSAPQTQLGGHFDVLLIGLGDGSVHALSPKNFDQLPA